MEQRRRDHDGEERAAHVALEKEAVEAEHDQGGLKSKHDGARHMRARMRKGGEHDSAATSISVVTMTDVLLRLNRRLTAAAAPACASSNLVIRRTCSRADPATRDGVRRRDPLLFTLTSAPGPSLTAARACPHRS